MKTYLEIVNIKTEKVEKRFDVSSISQIERMKIYDDKSISLAKTKFMRIINADEELESTPINPIKAKAKK
jgi:hypothetical protein